MCSISPKPELFVLELVIWLVGWLVSRLARLAAVWLVSKIGFECCVLPFTLKAMTTSKEARLGLMQG